MTTQEPQSVLSIKRFLERREQANLPEQTEHRAITHLHLHRDNPWNKPTACGHRPLSKLSLSQKRLQRNVVKTIIYEFSPKPQEANSENRNDKISNAWKALAQLVISRSGLLDPTLS